MLRARVHTFVSALAGTVVNFVTLGASNIASRFALAPRLVESVVLRASQVTIRLACTSVSVSFVVGWATNIAVA